MIMSNIDTIIVTKGSQTQLYPCVASSTLLFPSSTMQNVAPICQKFHRQQATFIIYKQLYDSLIAVGQY